VTNPKETTKFDSLEIRRVIPGSPERVFGAWTDPDEMKIWWGPADVRCLSAEVELREGGQYRIANELPDGSVLWISGEYKVVDRPHLLIYTWIVEGANPSTEQVSVRFVPHDLGTEVVITHDLISSSTIRDQHQQGWLGCMDGLVKYLTEITSDCVPR
jgi:uncharacterized protein YndB with AHSA1/START domain